MFGTNYTSEHIFPKHLSRFGSTYTSEHIFPTIKTVLNSTENLSYTYAFRNMGEAANDQIHAIE